MPLLALPLLIAALSAQEPTPAARFEPERAASFLAVRRLHIDKLTGVNSDQIRDLLIASIQSANIFVLTENPERADAILRGSAEDLVYNDNFQASDGIAIRGSLSAGSGSGQSRQSRSNGVSVSDRDSVRLSDRRHEATASLRLVNRAGDVLWAATHESRGAKFRGAAADVADKIARQLLADYQKIRKLPQPPPPAPPTLQ